MKYAALIEYIPDKEKIGTIRPAHRAYLTKLLGEGKLAIAGPFTDDYGAMIVYEASSAEEALTLPPGRPVPRRRRLRRAGRSGRGTR